MIEEGASIYFDDDIIENINKTEREINESKCEFKVEVITNKKFNDRLDILVNNNTTFNFASDSEAYAYISGIKQCLVIMNVIKKNK